MVAKQGVLQPDATVSKVGVFVALGARAPGQMCAKNSRTEKKIMMVTENLAV